MSVRLKAIYRDGAFVPVPNGEKLNVSENAEVEITVHDPYVLAPTATSDEERERALPSCSQAGTRTHFVPTLPV
jgi:hypothetical protein